MLILYNPPSNAGRKPVLPLSLLALGAVLEGRARLRHRRRQPGARPARRPWTGRSRAPAPHARRHRHARPAAEPTRCRCAARSKRRHPRADDRLGRLLPHPALRRLPAGAATSTTWCAATASWSSSRWSTRSPTETTHRRCPAWRFATRVRASRGRNPMAPIPHPDGLPDFPYHRVDVARYVRSSFMGRRTLAHHSSYGCPFFCNFCAVVNMVNGRWLAQSAERTANVVRSLVDRLGRRRGRVLRQQLLRPRGANGRIRRAASATWASAGGASRASTRCSILRTAAGS